MDARSARARFPRSRGDTPARSRAERRLRWVPPLARGYTPAIDTGSRRPGGSPARAGIHPRTSPRRGRRPRFPRSRGDTPAPSAPVLMPPMVPPLARGYTPSGGPGAIRDPGSPARAGIHPERPTAAAPGARFPRSRGDTPIPGIAVRRAQSVPPLARGYTRVASGALPPGSGSPARAGIHPHASRDRGGAQPVPPLARGYTSPSASMMRRGSGSPARAGIHPTRPTSIPSGSGFPRSRGDTPGIIAVTLWSIGVPPLARGYTRPPPPPPAAPPGSPARAGIHLKDEVRPPGGGRFPRSRGDTPGQSRAGASRRAVPPLARGYTRGSRRPRGGPIGSPARAGIHPEISGRPPCCARFPRSRGDTPVCPAARAGIHLGRAAPPATVAGFPRSRGDTPRPEGLTVRRGQVPPLARGYTRLGPVPRRRRRGFPRSRGGTLRLRSRRKVLTGPRREPTIPLRDDLNPQNGGRR